VHSVGHICHVFRCFVIVEMGPAEVKLLKTKRNLSCLILYVKESVHAEQ
jgi:hypothetical protein